MAINVENEFESIFIEISMIIGEIYRVPNTNETQSIERFHNITNKIKTTHCKAFIGTDQNFDLLKYDTNKNTQTLLGGFIESGFISTITKPTRVIHSTSTIIDNIYIVTFLGLYLV